MTPIPNEAAIKRSIELVQELENQSDRGAAIVGVAWVEEALVAAIHSFLDKHEKSWKRLFDRSGPLSTFSAKIDMARLLSMTSDAIYSDLHMLRGVRNDFAHSVLGKDNVPLTFATPDIRDKCLALRCVKHENISDPRHAFIRACAVLNSDFYMHEYFRQHVTDGGRIVAYQDDA
jgi:DNA-binding MltR family transcriptional regulator